jgi:hypothetical protein
MMPDPSPMLNMVKIRNKSYSLKDATFSRLERLTKRPEVSAEGPSSLIFAERLIFGKAFSEIMSGNKKQTIDIYF